MSSSKTTPTPPAVAPVSPVYGNFVQGLMGSSNNMQLGLSPEQQQQMRARVGMQNQQAVNNGLASMAHSLGSTTSPLFAQTAARMNAGAGSATAANMANVDVQNTQDEIANRLKQLGAQTQIGQLGLQARQQDITSVNSANEAANQLAIARLNAKMGLLGKYYKDQYIGGQTIPAGDTWSVGKEENDNLMERIGNLGL
jgi:hypothetical protein